MIAVRYYIERAGPFVAASACCVVLYYYRDALHAASAAKDIDFTGLYSAVFDWSAIQTGFLFGIFGYVAGKTDGFIQRVKNTTAMRLFIGYTRIAIFLGFIVTFISIPLMVSGFSLAPEDKWRFPVFMGWTFMSVWAFFSFLRVAYVFGFLIRPSDQSRVVG
ncbi:MAG: hypothetical protein ABIK36_12250 [Pseudomonadota bacterium]